MRRSAMRLLVKRLHALAKGKRRTESQWQRGDGSWWERGPNGKPRPLRRQLPVHVGAPMPDPIAPSPRVEKPRARTDPPGWSSPYFQSAAAEAIFHLTQLDGEQRTNALGITVRHYANADHAREWRDRLVRLVHPDRTDHPHADEAMAQLNRMHNSMTQTHPSEANRRRRAAERKAMRTAATAAPPPPPEHPGYASPAEARREAAGAKGTLKEYQAEAAGLRVKLVEEPHDARAADQLGFNERFQAILQRRIDRAEAWLKDNAGRSGRRSR